MIRVNEKILSLPPYLSTSWVNIKALRVEKGCLIVMLTEGINISIPGLSDEIIMTCFEFHQRAVESKTCSSDKAPVERFTTQPDQAIRFGMMGMETLGNAMQHSFELRDSGPLPQEILSKIEAVTRAIAPEMKVDLPKAEPHCNCPHCQVARAIQRGLGDEIAISHQAEGEEQVLEEELHFEEWIIEPSGLKLYTVTNKIDANEKYSVFLGDPVGCTCGKNGCEHILAVLRS